MSLKIPEDILQILEAVSAKRPKTVIDHIIKHGYITTEELKNIYGYNHPPRAARDVRDLGIPLETFSVKDSTSRSIGAYRFADWNHFKIEKLKGRLAFSKQFKKELVVQFGKKCVLCSASLEERYLQIDHRVPYAIAGDEEALDRNPENYMLLCSSCNRAKSWSCEHCSNWNHEREESVCQKCYWASPCNYEHIAMYDIRRLALVWQGKEVSDFDKIIKMAKESSMDVTIFIKTLISGKIKKK